jgi:protein TonB
MGYAFTAKPIFHPVVFNPISDGALASKGNGEVVEFFAVTEKPAIIKKATPVYPDLARKAQVEGVVVVTEIIGKTGQGENAKIVKSIPMLNAAALDAAYPCRFKPAKAHDKIVRVKMNIPFKFKLK